jgi:tRNA pseudouridine32 synthase / 23S rRNA pseudouridine746 synthase
LNPLAIIFEDKKIIAVNKPSGQAVIPGRGLEQEPLVTQVTAHIGTKAFVVHRIDLETSGLVVFAKDADIHRKLSQLWEEHGVKKTYLAWVLGIMEKTEGSFRGHLKEFGSGRMGVDPKGKPSETHYKVLKTSGENTLLEVEPLTGRRHQIRVHFYHSGHPVLGDPLYGKERPVGGQPRLLLHAAKLVFRHMGEDLLLTVEPPSDFQISPTAK